MSTFNQIVGIVKLDCIKPVAEFLGFLQLFTIINDPVYYNEHPCD